MHHFRGEMGTPGLRSLLGLFWEASSIPSPAAGSAGKRKVWEKGWEKLSLYQSRDALQTPARKGGREEARSTWERPAKPAQRTPRLQLRGEEPGLYRGLSRGRKEASAQDSASVYSFVVPHWPQMFAGPRRGSCQHQLSKSLRDAECLRAPCILGACLHSSWRLNRFSQGERNKGYTKPITPGWTCF